MLIDGKWTEDWQPVQAKDEKGGFVRQTSSFRHWVTPDGSAGPTGDAGFAAEAGRYHLYVALICPWASRTLIARKLKGLEEAISRFGGRAGPLQPRLAVRRLSGLDPRRGERRGLYARALHAR